MLIIYEPHPEDILINICDFITDGLSYGKNEGNPQILDRLEFDFPASKG